MDLEEAAATVLASAAFREKRRSHLKAQFGLIELQLLARQVEDAERQVAQREAGVRWALVMGLPRSMGAAVANMIYAEALEDRVSAAALFVAACARAAA